MPDLEKKIIFNARKVDCVFVNNQHPLLVIVLKVHLTFKLLMMNR